MHLPAGEAGDAGKAGGAGATEREPPGAYRPGELRIAVRRAGPVRIVSVGGELDHDSADGLRTALSVPPEGGPEGGPDRILVDLAELSFCDSTGLNVLLRARQDAELAGVRLEIAGPRPIVVRLFAVTGADSVLRIHPSLDLALSADGGRAAAPDPGDPGDSSGSGGSGPTAGEGP
ncbi:STAS domain-containing protein [Kitasatospora misakiensis]|uniref:Anti-sigma factor antagonist n=1 Tax=Kitasatospora misakiensis TaxID=67330 RepID=A0ABW0X3X9_9ACTN